MWRNSSINLLKQAFTTSVRSTGPVPATPYSRVLGTSSFHRYCSSAFVGGGDGKSKESEMTHAEAKRIMRLVNVEGLKEKLGMEDKEVIPYTELLNACQSMGVAKSDEEAAVFARVLDDAGVVFLFRDKAHLRPHKVFHLAQKLLPLELLPEDDPTKLEYENLKEKKEEIDMLAHKQVHRILTTGLGVLVIQVGLFFRLTFWEFSWDVMEPIAFFTTAAGLTISYAYFLKTYRDPSYQDVLKRLFLSRQRKLIKKHNFDIQRFVGLQMRCNHPKDSCAALKKRTGVEIEPDDLLHDH